MREILASEGEVQPRVGCFDMTGVDGRRVGALLDLMMLGLRRRTVCLGAGLDRIGASWIELRSGKMTVVDSSIAKGETRTGEGSR